MNINLSFQDPSFVNVADLVVNGTDPGIHTPEA
jgi:hypothetical protein